MEHGPTKEVPFGCATFSQKISKALGCFRSGTLRKLHLQNHERNLTILRAHCSTSYGWKGTERFVATITKLSPEVLLLVIHYLGNRSHIVNTGELTSLSNYHLDH